MKLAILSFVSALVWSAFQPIILYDPVMLAGVPPALLGLARRGVRPLCGAFLGLVLAGGHATAIQSTELDAALEGRDLEIRGTVSGLPRSRQGLVRFAFTIERCAGCANVRRVILSWYGDVRVRPGERWRLTVRLSRPRGTVNPGLFDYEGWLFSRGIGATGYVRQDARNRRLDSGFWRAPHQRLRYALQMHIEEVAGGSPMGGLLMALTLGESGRISPANWQVLSDTGTNHLFVISGLHVGMVTALCYRLCLLMCGRLRAGMISLAVALLYGLIAGMGLPVQRALVMTTVAVGGTLLNRRVPAGDMFCYALLGVTLIDPLAVLGTGFWLSFGAVFSLLFVFAGRRVRVDRGMPGWGLAAIRTQWVVFIGMVPFLLYLVFQVSLVSFLVNMVAIPWIGLLVVPLSVAAVASLSISTGLSALLLLAAEGLLAPAWQFLAWVAGGKFVYFASATGMPALLLGLIGSLTLLAPRGFMPRWPGVVLMIPLFSPVPDLPRQGELSVTVLDVGQGLSVFMRTQNGAVLYDAGPRFGDRFDAGAQIVTPFVRRSGTSRLTAFILSHTDSDHAGGAPAVLDNLVAGRFFSSDPDRGPGAGSCNRDLTWHLDGIRFGLLGLPRAGAGTNDRSCILLIQGSGFAALLPGDIEASVEYRLLDVPMPGIDLMLVPHHGSHSSSSPAFLNHVMADTVVVSAGYRNRFNHPHPTVMKRYLARNARVLSTAEEGAITIRLGRHGIHEVASARTKNRRFWYDQLKSKRDLPAISPPP